jgi:hypothetical protein
MVAHAPAPDATENPSVGCSIPPRPTICLASFEQAEASAWHAEMACHASACGSTISLVS